MEFKSKFQLNLLNEDVALPAAALDINKITHNINWMQSFANTYKIKLCPHGKTTMCPALFHLQLKGGAYGISLATASQVKVAQSAGIPRILMVNQLVGKQNMSIISDIFRQDPTFEFACLVDSAANVRQLGTFFRNKNQRLRVLLEFGYPGGRTGVRTIEQEYGVTQELNKFKDTLQLVGVEFYEAILKTEDSVRKFIRYVAERTQELENKGAFTEESIIISAAGSDWFDIVAKELSDVKIIDEENNSVPLDIVLRPGSYLTHEIGTYHDAKLRVQEEIDICMSTPPMITSLQVWAYVQSIPESGLVILGMGKREADVSFNCEFPIPCLHFRPSVDHKPALVNNNWRVTYVMDQHAFMKVGAKDDIQIGDMVAFETCYPGTTLDKFRKVFLTDEHYNILDSLNIQF